MGLLIVSIILTAIVFVLLSYGIVNKKNYRGDEVKEIQFKVRGRSFLSLFVMLLVLLNFIAVIPANTVGVQYSPFTGVREEVLREGMHAKGFFDTIYKISTEVQTKRIENIYGQTKDSQYITMVLDVKYQVDVKEAFNVFKQFKTLDNVDKDLIEPATQRSVEAITTNYNIIELLGSKRNEVYKGIEIDLKERFFISGINLYSVTLIDTDAGAAIENAIQNEAVAKKAVETAEQERQKIEVEAKKRIIEAEADREKRVIEAEADKQRQAIEAQTLIIVANARAEAKVIEATATAQAKVIEAESQAKAYKLINDSLTEAVIQSLWIEQWNGIVPTFVTDGSGFIYNMK
jgi:prohibitin 1